MIESPENSGQRREAGQRIDQWLWQARFFKTRTLASKFVAAGRVRLTNGPTTRRITKTAQLLHPGDILTFTSGQRVRVIEVAHLASRRGPASEAHDLYHDLSPAAVSRTTGSERLPQGKGGGRPTKKQRRALDRLKPEM